MMHDDWSKFQFYQYELIKKLLKTNKTNALKKSLANSLNNIGYIYHNQRDTPKALEYCYKILNIQEEIGNKGGIADSLNKLGFNELKKENTNLIAAAKKTLAKSAGNRTRDRLSWSYFKRF